MVKDITPFLLKAIERQSEWGRNEAMEFIGVLIRHQSGHIGECEMYDENWVPIEDETGVIATVHLNLPVALMPSTRATAELRALFESNSVEMIIYSGFRIPQFEIEIRVFLEATGEESVDNELDLHALSPLDVWYHLI